VNAVLNLWVSEYSGNFLIAAQMAASRVSFGSMDLVKN
jgi:hypothetical protein